MLNWRRLFRHTVSRARNFAFASAGDRSAARIAMMAITTSKSTRVKPRLLLMLVINSEYIPRLAAVKANESAEDGQREFGVISLKAEMATLPGIERGFLLPADFIKN